MKKDNYAEYKKLTHFTHNHRAQRLAAELKAQRKSNSLSHGKPRMRLFFDKTDNALNSGNDQNHRSRRLQQERSELYKVFQYDFRPMK